MITNFEIYEYFGYNTDYKPSQFIEYFPTASIFKKTECEIVAMNIMVILQRTGDIFRSLSWIEYKIEREKDSNFSLKEKMYFDMVIPYLKNSDDTIKFSPNWDLDKKIENDAKRYNL